MTQLEMLTTLVDAVAVLPETKHLRRAIFRAQRRIEVLRNRRAMLTRRSYHFYDAANRLLHESFKPTERPVGTAHIIAMKVWRYPDAQRPINDERRIGPERVWHLKSKA